MAELTRYVCSLCGDSIMRRTNLAVYGTCRECNNGWLRRARVDASLPQRLESAARSLKEP